MTVRAYCRVSTARQADRASLETQREAIARFATNQDAPVAVWYTDVLSGRRDDRPEYVRLLADLQRGDSLLVWRLDRIGRKKSELFRFFEECKRRQINLISVTQPELSNELARDLMSVIAAYESQQIAERVLPGMLTRTEQGKWVSRVPLFYKMGSDGRLTPAANAHEAQQVWDAVLRTGSIEEAATLIGINTITLRAALRRRVYLGETVWNGITILNTHPAIVTSASWDAVDQMRKERAKARRRQHLGTALLTGFVYVEETERRLYHYMRRGRGGVERRYYVTTDGEHQPRHSIRADDAERCVVDCLKTLTLSDAQRREIERELRQRAKADPSKRERAALQRRLTKLEAEEIETARMEAQRRITAIVADRMRQEQQKEHHAVQGHLDALPPLVRPQDAGPVLLMRVNLAERIEADYRARNWTALRILVEAFITRVNVFEGQATRHQWRQRPRRIEVVWNQRSLT